MTRYTLQQPNYFNYFKSDAVLPRSGGFSFWKSTHHFVSSSSLQSYPFSLMMLLVLKLIVHSDSGGGTLACLFMSSLGFCLQVWVRHSRPSEQCRCLAGNSNAGLVPSRPKTIEVAAVAPGALCRFSETREEAHHIFLCYSSAWFYSIIFFFLPCFSLNVHSSSSVSCAATAPSSFKSSPEAIINFCLFCGSSYLSEGMVISDPPWSSTAVLSLLASLDLLRFP